MASFTVTTHADVVDANDGVLSLREAIADAQSRRGADRIEFDSGIFLAGGPEAARTVSLALGELVVGGGGGRLIIDGGLDGDRSPDVILDAGGDSRVLNATGTLRLEGLVITGGRVEAATAEGGGILAETLILRGSSVTGNTAEGEIARGGGIAADDVTIVDSSLIENAATGYADDTQAEGGAVHAPTVRIVRSDVEANRVFSSNRSGYSEARGGAIFATDISIINSNLARNVAIGEGDDVQVAGGAVHAETMRIIRSDLDANVGSAQSSAYSASTSGGAVFASDLMILNSRFTSNEADSDSNVGNRSFGGAVHAQTLTVSQSAFTGNRTSGYYSRGGAVSGGGVTIERSRFEANVAGGLYSKGGAVEATNLHIANSAVIDNRAFSFRFSDGGGLFASETAIVESTNIRRNTADTVRYDASGGGIRAGSATITDSRITGNETSAGRSADGGGVYAGTLSLTDSLVRANGVAANYDARGGGIAGSNVTIVGATISRNQITDRNDNGLYESFGGGVAARTGAITNTTIADNINASEYAFGGGISLGAGTITHATITGNRAAGPGGDGYAEPSPSGGGLQAGSGVTLRNSIVVGNLAMNAALDEIGGGLVVISNSLVGGDAALIFADTVVIEVGGRTTVAGALAGNGGFTPTAALRDDPGNPAVDAGDPAFGLPTDQRGVPRDASPDLGAYEIGPSPAASGGGDMWG